MRLIHTGSRFEAVSSYEERFAVKDAGFRWDPGTKRWWTDLPERAARLAQVADDSAKAALAAHTAAVEASRASSVAPEAAAELPCPSGLSYLPYQAAGIRYAMTRKGVLIGDEPGLGKTIQAIGIVNSSPDARRVLVVCPASLRLNWAREANKWLTRAFKVTVITNGESLDLCGDDSQMVIVNYDRLAKRPELAAAAWDVMIVDEAHYAKNPKAARSKQIYALAKKSARVVALTGTPILNRPIELHPILAMLDEKTWGNFWSYARRYCDAHKEHVPGQGEIWNLQGSSNLPELQEKLRASVMVRRCKADVLTELPSKRRSYVPLLIKGHKEDAAATTLREKLQTLAELRAVAHELGDDEAAELYSAEEKRTAAVAFTEMSAYRRELGLTKVVPAIEYVEELMEAGVSKVVVFAHHNEVVKALLDKFGAAAVGIFGDTSLEDRQAAVDAFQARQDVKVFVGSIMAAGVGLTLTAASHVVMVESDWVPANMVQAEDRCHRIGQKDMVQVHVLTVPGSLDEYMLQMVEDKAEIAASALDNGTSIEVSADMLEPKASKGLKPGTHTVAVELRQTLLSALRHVAARCDGAAREDGAGFNKMDTSFGKRLAQLSDLTDKQFAAANKMLRKYRRQVPDGFAEVLGW